MTNKRKLRRRLAREAATLKCRLESAVVANPAGPVLGRANIAYELSYIFRDPLWGSLKSQCRPGDSYADRGAVRIAL